MSLSLSFSSTALALTLLALGAHSSLYDPHVPPQGNVSFFEGWYTRIIAADGNSSFSVLFGLTHPSSGTGDTNPRALITIVHQDTSSPATSMQAFTAFPAASSVTITHRDVPVTTNPDFKEPPNFRWEAKEFGYQETRGSVTTINFTIHGASLHAETNSITPWTLGNSGLGPSGLLDMLPLPLHWFVLSLSSSVASYTFANGERKISGFGGRAHMEKNWGGAFPDKWLWAEALGSDCVAFAFSGGDLELWGSALSMNTSHLAGYRNANKHISWNFSPVNSLMNFAVDACSGDLSFNLRHKFLPRSIIVSASAPAASLRTCLWSPAPRGFVPMSTETFLATIDITLLSHRFGRKEVVDHVVMRNSALEFGGAYRCFAPDPCLQRR